MAEIKGIEVLGEVYEVADETARIATENNATAIDSAKESVESLDDDMNGSTGKIAGLAKQANDIEEKVGDLDTSLDTTAQTLVGAVNELASNQKNWVRAWTNPSTAQEQSAGSATITIPSNAKYLRLLAGSISNSENTTIYFESTYDSTKLCALKNSFVSVDPDSSVQLVASRTIDYAPTLQRLSWSNAGALDIDTDENIFRVRVANYLLIPFALEYSL